MVLQQIDGTILRTNNLSGSAARCSCFNNLRSGSLSYLLLLRYTRVQGTTHYNMSLSENYYNYFFIFSFGFIHREYYDCLISSI